MRAAGNRITGFVFVFHNSGLKHLALKIFRHSNLNVKIYLLAVVLVLLCCLKQCESNKNFISAKLMMGDLGFFNNSPSLRYRHYEERSNPFTVIARTKDEAISQIETKILYEIASGRKPLAMTPTRHCEERSNPIFYLLNK